MATPPTTAPVLTAIADQGMKCFAGLLEQDQDQERRVCKARRNERARRQAIDHVIIGAHCAFFLLCLAPGTKKESSSKFHPPWLDLC